MEPGALPCVCGGKYCPSCAGSSTRSLVLKADVRAARAYAFGEAIRSAMRKAAESVALRKPEARPGTTSYRCHRCMSDLPTARAACSCEVLP